MGREESDDDADHVRAYVGAVLLAEGLAELKNIRKLLTAKE
jgi:hypothetical protein